MGCCEPIIKNNSDTKSGKNYLLSDSRIWRNINQVFLSRLALIKIGAGLSLYVLNNENFAFRPTFYNQMEEFVFISLLSGFGCWWSFSILYLRISPS